MCEFFFVRRVGLIEKAKQLLLKPMPAQHTVENECLLLRIGIGVFTQRFDEFADLLCSGVVVVEDACAAERLDDFEVLHVVLFSVKCARADSNRQPRP